MWQLLVRNVTVRVSYFKSMVVKKQQIYFKALSLQSDNVKDTGYVFIFQQQTELSH